MQSLGQLMLGQLLLEMIDFQRKKLSGMEWNARKWDLENECPLEMHIVFWECKSAVTKFKTLRTPI